MRRSGFILLLIVAVAATLAPLLTDEFVGWDDQATINSNPLLKPPTFQSMVYYWRHSAGGLYIPLTYNFWTALATVAQSRTSQGMIELNPWVFHGASIALHIGSAAVVFSILRRLLKRDGPALVGAMLFALHPVQVETVAWASGAKDLLCGLLSLIAMLQYLRWRGVGSSGSAVGSASADRSFSAEADPTAAPTAFPIAIFAMLAAMLAKPTAIVVPLMAGAIDLWIIGRPVRCVVRPILLMLLLTIPCIIWTRLVQESHLATYTPLWTRPLIAADAIAFYLYKIVFPYTLTIIYGRTPQSVLASGALWWTWIVPAAIGVVLFFFRGRVPWLVGCALAFVGALLPVLGFTRFSFQGHSTVADHYLYLPMFPVALAAAWLISRRPTTPVYVACGIILAALAWRSRLQTSYWRDDLSLFTHAVRVVPDSAGAQGNLGVALARVNRLAEAGPHLARAAELAPDSRESQVMVAQAYAFSGQYAEALPYAQAAVRLAEQENDPNDAWEQMLLGKSLAGLGRLAEAEPHLVRAAKLRPNEAGYAAELAALRRKVDAPTTKP